MFFFISMDEQRHYAEDSCGNFRTMRTAHTHEETSFFASLMHLDLYAELSGTRNKMDTLSNCAEYSTEKCVPTEARHQREDRDLYIHIT